MKGSGLFSCLSLVFLILLSSSSAWPWPPSLGEIGDRLDTFLSRRQDNQDNEDNQESSSSRSSSATATAKTSTSASRSSSATTDPDAEESASASGTITDINASETKSANSTRTSSTKTTPIDPRLPPGGISLITPAPIDGVQYYKVGDPVTFKWNYTSLSITPSAIDVLASCALNSATYTISSNMSVEETGAVTWDTGDFEATATNPFVVASYTLIVHDAAKEVTDVPSAGELGAYAQYVFGMYTGQPYVPLNEFRCASCNGALSIHEKQALGVILTTAAITIMSFTWFANGFGAF
ncbi:hypothetical protein LTR84_002192 [Exophiala bonariae]|uniref:DUF7137 domain-containing protein n=1 Tax=Exophiala bonariae TaxID=1690606 RepID=A0AAV9NAM0_9EURO|nr:hypothetical protein LTR84_002192 [Exophiala bonariae]